MEAATTHCINCQAELPNDAAFCMRCGSPQTNELRGGRLVLSQGSHYLLMRLTTLALGIVFMGMLLWIAITDKYFSWSDPLFWTAVIVIIVAFGLIPQVLWRRKPGSPKEKIDPNIWLPIVAMIVVPVSYLLLILWGGRVANALTVSANGTVTVAQVATILMVAGNAALAIGLTYTVDSLEKRKAKTVSTRNRAIALIAAQLALNVVAEVVWHIFNR